MSSFIVTVTDKYGRFSYDMEIPDNIPCRKLIKDVAQTVMSNNNGMLIKTAEQTVYINKLNRYMMPDETLDSAGVWTGDIITVG